MVSKAISVEVFRLGVNGGYISLPSCDSHESRAPSRLLRDPTRLELAPEPPINFIVLDVPAFCSSLPRTMSSSEENFDLDVSGSESEDYAPAPKKTAKAPPKTKAAPAKAAPKPALKPKATTKKKVLVDKDDNASEPEDGSNREMVISEKAAGPSKKKTASEMYQKARPRSTAIYLRV